MVSSKDKLTTKVLVYNMLEVKQVENFNYFELTPRSENRGSEEVRARINAVWVTWKELKSVIYASKT